MTDRDIVIAFSLQNASNLPQAVTDLRALAELRESLSAEEFRGALADVADEESIDGLNRLLDQLRDEGEG